MATDQIGCVSDLKSMTTGKEAADLTFAEIYGRMVKFTPITMSSCMIIDHSNSSLDRKIFTLRLDNCRKSRYRGA
jgi:hypothetical protein